MSLLVVMVLTIPGVVPPPPPPFGAPFTDPLLPDSLPARSTAVTWNVYVVPAFRLPIVAVVVSLDAVFVPSTYTLYPSRPMPPLLSFDAFQVSVTFVGPVPLILRPPGTEGAVLSLDGFVVTRTSA